MVGGSAWEPNICTNGLHKKNEIDKTKTKKRYNNSTKNDKQSSIEARAIMDNSVPGAPGSPGKDIIGRENN